MTTLQDQRIGTKAAGDAPRVPPQQDVLGKVPVEGATEVGVGHGHYVVVPVAVADHLVDAAVEQVKQLVAAHYAAAKKAKKKEEVPDGSAADDQT